MSRDRRQTPPPADGVDRTERSWLVVIAICAAVAIVLLGRVAAQSWHATHVGLLPVQEEETSQPQLITPRLGPFDYHCETAPCQAAANGMPLAGQQALQGERYLCVTADNALLADDPTKLPPESCSIRTGSAGVLELAVTYTARRSPLQLWLWRLTPRGRACLLHSSLQATKRPVRRWFALGIQGGGRLVLGLHLPGEAGMPSPSAVVHAIRSRLVQTRGAE